MSTLTDLPNIGRTLAARLEEAGITSGEELAEVGSVAALLRIGAATGTGCYNMLYALEGAIEGVRWHDLPPQLRARRKAELDAARG